MQPEARDPVWITDMLNAARGALHALRSVSLEEYRVQENLRLAVERRLEIMGEAARHVSDALRERHPEIPWRGIVGQRNVLIHAYATIQDDLVWRLAEVQLPALIPMLETVLRELGVADES
jgi:uncharacterized protein with HEPN domain